MSQALMERPRNSLSEKAEHFLQHELHHEVSVSQLAEHCGTSERSLLRHFRTHHGVTPVAALSAAPAFTRGAACRTASPRADR